MSIIYLSGGCCAIWFNNVQNTCEYQPAIGTAWRVIFQHATKTNFVPRLCSPIWKWFLICPKLSAVAKKEKSHHSSPLSSPSLPSSKPQSHRTLQFTVLLSALLWPSQWQEKWEQEPPKSPLKIHASWVRNIQGLSHMKNMCKNRIKTLLHIFRIAEGWKSRENFSLKCVLVINKNTVDVKCLLQSVNQAELLFMLHFTFFLCVCFIPLLDGASVSLLKWLLALHVSYFYVFILMTAYVKD